MNQNNENNNVIPNMDNAIQNPNIPDPSLNNVQNQTLQAPGTIENLTAQVDPVPTPMPQPEVIVPQPENVDPALQGLNLSQMPENNNIGSVPPTPIDNTPTMTPPPISNDNNALPTEEKKKKSKLPIILIIILLLLVGCGFFVYKTMFTNPIETTITAVFKEVKSNKLLSNKNMKDTTTITFESQDEMMSFLNKYSLNAEVSYDTDYNVLLKAALNENGNALLDVNSYITKDRIYIGLPKLIDKTYYLPIESSSTNIKNEDVLYLVDRYEEGLKKAFKDEKLYKENKEVTLNGNTLKVKYNYYIIDKNNVKNISNKFLSAFEDTKSLEIISNITKQSVDDIKGLIKEAKEDDYSDFDKPIKFGIYTKGLMNTFAGIEIDEDNKKIIDYVIDGKSGSGEIIFDDNNKISITNNENKYNLTLVINNKTVGHADIEEINNTEYKIDVVINDLMTIKINEKIQEVSTIEVFDTNGAIDYTTITQEDLELIQTNLMTTLQNSDLYMLLVSMLGSDEPDDITDFEY